MWNSPFEVVDGNQNYEYKAVCCTENSVINKVKEWKVLGTTHNSQCQDLSLERICNDMPAGFYRHLLLTL